MVWGTLRKLGILMGIALVVIAGLNFRMYRMVADHVETTSLTTDAAPELNIEELRFTVFDDQEPDNYLGDAVLEKVTFQAQKDKYSTETITRSGKLLLRKNAKATVLICHGYMCSKQDIQFLRMLFPNYNCMVFDFRAHGDHTSDEQCCTFGKNELFDVIAAAHFIKSHPHLKDTKLLGYGFSMGAVSLIRAQARAQQFDALVLDCPFDCSSNVLSTVLNNMRMNLCGYNLEVPGRELIMKYAFHPYVEPIVRGLIKAVHYSTMKPINSQLVALRPLNAAKKISVPCFFIHCRNDEKVPLQAAKSLYASVQGPKRLWITNGRHHFDSYFNNPEKYAYRANQFFEHVILGKFNKIPREQILVDTIAHKQGETS